MQKRLVRVLPELIQNIKENNITIKKYVKALMLGIFKSLSLYEIPFSQKNISHVKKFIIDIPAKNIRRTKKGNAFLIGTIAKLIKPSSKFSQVYIYIYIFIRCIHVGRIRSMQEFVQISYKCIFSIWKMP